MSVHVVLLASWYKTPRRPVLGSFIEEQARAMQAQGARVAVVHPLLHPFRERFDAGREPEPPDAVDEGLPTLRAHACAPLPRAARLAHAWLARRTESALGRHAAVHGMPDVLHAHATFHGGIAGAILARRLGLPLVLTEHLSSLVDPSWPSRPREAADLARTFAAADRALVVSSALRDALPRFGIDAARVQVVPNLVAPQFFEDVGPPPPGPFTFFSVSHLIPRKRMDLLIRAFAAASRAEPGLALRIGGDGPERPRLEALVRDLGLQGSVTLLGELDRARVAREMRACHAFALASSFETFGVVVAEALACGRPVAVTDSGGVRDVVGEGDGIVVTEATPEALAGALLRLKAAGPDPLALSARARARFSAESVARRLLAIYEEVLRSYTSTSSVTPDRGSR